MSSRNFARLSLLPLLLIALAALWVFWPAQQKFEGTHQERVEETSLDSAYDLEPAPSPAMDDGLIQRTEFVDPVIALTENIALGYPPERDILVRAELTLVEEEPGHPPKNCEGWEVVAQTWIAETGEVARFYATSDKNGIAEFHFPDFIHVDWVLCTPPEDSGYAISFYEGHDDLGPDDNYHVLLHQEPSKGAFGYVKNAQDQPVEGAVVHAFDDGWTYELADWTPGFLTTTTDHNGRFSFDQLPPATWAFAVEPEQWLMLEPMLGHQHESFGIAEVKDDATEAAHAGTLIVIPMVVMELQMVGSHGAPAVGANLFLEPLTFDDRFVQSLFQDDRTEDEKAAAMFSSDSQNVLRDLPYSFSFTSNREGKVTLRLLRGRYNMKVEPLPGMRDGDENPPLEFHTNQGHLTYRFQAPLNNLRGTVAGNDGTPMAQATVGIKWSLGDDEWASDDRECNAVGEFVFQSVRLGGDFEVTVWSGTDAWLPLAKTFGHFDFRKDLDLVLSPASKAFLDFDLEVMPDRVGYVRLLSFTPLEGDSFDPDSRWWLYRQNSKHYLRNKNQVRITNIQAGTYEIALFHTPVGYKPVEGTALPILEVQRYTMETGTHWQKMKVDWPR